MIEQERRPAVALTGEDAGERRESLSAILRALCGEVILDFIHLLVPDR